MRTNSEYSKLKDSNQTNYKKEKSTSFLNLLNIKKYKTEHWMILPSIIILAIISIFPFLYLIYASFMDFMISSDQPTFNGITNWKKVLINDTFWASWGRTLIFAVVGLLLEVMIGVGIALAIYELPKGRNLVVTLWMIPIFVAPIVAGLLGRFLLNSTYGLYAWLLSLVGIDVQILGDVKTALAAVILMDVWEWTPLITMIVLAGLQSLPKEPLEAAQVDGANYMQRLIKVVFPLVSRTILVALLIRSMDILRFVDTIKITTEGGPADSTKVIGFYLMEVAFKFQDFGAAAALGLTMLFATIFLGKQFVNFMTKGDE
ncbi:carbohydrate ABC transporter permease [Metabacillus litoralis]|uniref:ABC transporter permease n=2 Tax=Metabacillus TaxID=2675233 RepID=A0A179SQM3_9BACI|nr:sugar ABC transporter permease [Metabacillus litoralis]OAS82603.1 ABC transporter permease [Metabacillus litoralis]